jgi:hypothetical protein
MTSDDSEALPDIDLQVGEKRVRISVTPVEWVILSVAAIVLAVLLR